eukprot:scaffold8922_cov287-Chaetoceros_neogracile.AAC.14
MSTVTSFVNLSKISYAMIVCSFMIEISHLRCFPSYNMVIAALAFFLCHTTHSSDEEQQPPCAQVALIGCFSTLSIISILIDIVFCTIWGGDIIEGDRASVKFSFFCFIINIFFKLGALVYATSAQIDHGELHDVASSKCAAQRGDDEEKDASALGENSDLERENKQKDDDLSEDSNDYMMETGLDVTTTPRSDHSLDIPYPPFTPGISGLVSPYPRKVNIDRNN